MVEKIIEFLSRQPPFLGGCRLKVDENQAQIKYREKRKSSIYWKKLGFHNSYNNTGFKM